MESAYDSLKDSAYSSLNTLGFPPSETGEIGDGGSSLWLKEVMSDRPAPKPARGHQKVLLRETIPSVMV